jgi:aspartate racemase
VTGIIPGSGNTRDILFMSDLCVGVIGGMGPDATVDFMARVLAATPATCDQDHVRMLVEQDPRIPSRQRALLGKGDSPGPHLAAIASRLEASGCDFLVMPCNTAHHFIADILAATRLPFLSIIDVTMARVRASGHARIGLLASAACLHARIYQDAMAAVGVELVLQSRSELADLSLLIGKIKTGDHGPAVRTEASRLGKALVDRGADALVLGCTELPIVLDGSEIDIPTISSNELLAKATVAIATGKAPLPGR